MKNESFKLDNMKIVQVFVLALVLLAIELIAGFTIYHTSVSTAYEGAFAKYIACVGDVSSDLNTALTTDAANGSDYAMTGSLNGDALTLDGTSYTVAETAGQNLRKSAVNFYTLSELCRNTSTPSPVYAVYSILQEDGTYLVKLRTLTDLLAQVSPSGFDGIVLISGSGRIVHAPVQAPFAGGYVNPREAYPQTITRSGTEYVLALTPLGDGDYYIMGYADFSESIQGITDLLTRTIVMVVITCVLTLVLFLVGCGVFGGLQQRRTVYRIVTDADGQILQSNAAFSEDFSDVDELKERVNRFDEGKYYTLKFGKGTDEQLLVCTVKKRGNGTILLKAGKLTVPEGSRVNAESLDTMEAKYNSYLKRGKRVFAGEIFMGNLQNFKTLFGNDFSDRVREIVLGRIKEKFTYVSEHDYFHIGVLYPDGKDLEFLLQDLPDVVTYINQPVQLENNLVNVGLKCGFAICDEIMENRDFSYAITAVGAALKRVKEDKLREYYVYHESQKKLYAKYFFEIDIKKMLENDDFEMEYQPQYGLKAGKIVGFEALFRVKKRVELNASTFDVISYAERSGGMVLLGEFIFDTGMRFAKSVEDTGVSVSLNVSPVQLMQAGFVDSFLKIYRKYDLKPGAICIEITESFLMTTFDETLKKLEILRQNGIQVHLDDFGTTYSSLLYLKKLPISTIKVDREFVIDIKENKYSQTITKMVLNISKELGLSSICEGIETQEQLNVLRSFDEDVIIQGYLIGKSVKADAAREMIETFRLEETPMPETNAESAVPVSAKKGRKTDENTAPMPETNAESAVPVSAKKSRKTDENASPMPETNAESAVPVSAKKNRKTDENTSPMPAKKPAKSKSAAKTKATNKATKDNQATANATDDAQS